MRPLTHQLGAMLDDVWPRAIDAQGDAVARWSPDDPSRYCPRCGASAGPGSVTPGGCAFCHGQRPPWTRITRLGGYVEPLDGWIRAMKFARQWTWARFLGEALAGQLGPSLDEQRTVVCAVPMHWMRRWSRGFNQAQLMSEHLAQQRRWPVARLLHRTRHTAPQTAVSRSQRAANIRGSIAAAQVDLTGWHVVLVDDVKTTGATLGGGARLLRQAGAVSVHAAVAAVADPHHTDFKTIRA